MAASIVTNPPEKGGLSFRKLLDSVVNLELVEPTRHGEGPGAER